MSRAASQSGVRRCAVIVESGARTLLGLLVLAMVLLNVVNAAGRYLIGRGIDGSDELLVYAMVWLVFLGAVLVTKDRRHLRFDVLQGAMATAKLRWLDFFSDLVMLGLAGFIAYQSWQVVGRLAEIGQRSMAAGVPMFVPHAAILVGLGLMAAVLCAGAVSRLAGWGDRSDPGCSGGGNR